MTSVGILGRTFTPVPGASLAFFRVAFGLIVLVATVRPFAHGWIDDLTIFAGIAKLNPDWPILAMQSFRLRRGTESVASSAGSRQRVPSISQPWLLYVSSFALGLFVIAQALVPPRQFAYPGNMRWTEEGYLYSWRVLLTEKIGLVHYRVIDTASGRSWLVTPDDYLTPLQVERMSSQPDLILQTAHFIGDDFLERGYGQVKVTPEAIVSCNSRPKRRADRS